MYELALLPSLSVTSFPLPLPYRCCTCCHNLSWATQEEEPGHHLQRNRRPRRRQQDRKYTRSFIHIPTLFLIVSLSLSLSQSSSPTFYLFYFYFILFSISTFSVLSLIVTFIRNYNYWKSFSLLIMIDTEVSYHRCYLHSLVIYVLMVATCGQTTFISSIYFFISYFLSLSFSFSLCLFLYLSPSLCLSFSLSLSLSLSCSLISFLSMQIELELKVDESIYGGLQILVGDKFLDLSVRNRLAAFDNIFS